MHLLLLLLIITISSSSSSIEHKHIKTHHHSKTHLFHHRQLPPHCHVVCDPTPKPSPRPIGPNPTHQPSPLPIGPNPTTTPNDDDYDDDDSDNEIAIISTSLAPNQPLDININNESGDEYIKGQHPLVDFIVIKHRFSNATNLAYPPYFPNKRRHQRKKKTLH